MIRTKIFSLILLVALYSFAFQGFRSVWDPSEGRYVCVATMMLQTGDWIHPLLHSELSHWTKPPMVYWAIAAGIKMFGFTEFAVRFFNSLAFMLTIWLIVYLGKIFSPRCPWLPALIYGTSIFPFVASNIITTDYLLSFFETAGMSVFIYTFWKSRESRAWRYGNYLGWAAFGLAFLTKGPPALLPLLSVFGFIHLSKNSTGIRFIPFFKGITAFLLLGGFWYVWVVSEAPELLNYFLWNETILRVSTGIHQRNNQWYGAFVIYIPVLFLGSLPWTAMAYGQIKTYFRKLILCIKSQGQQLAHEDMFLMLWFFIPLIVFFIAKSRLALYVLPLFVPLSLLTARAIDVKKLTSRKKVYGLAVWCVFLLSLRVFAGFVSTPDDNKHISQDIAKLCTSCDFDEIVFVESKPYYGLSLYLNVPIEQINLVQNSERNDIEGNLDEELLEDEGIKLWMIPKINVAQFRKMMLTRRTGILFLGEIKGKKEYSVFIDKV